MNASVSPFIEHRDETRVPGHAAALMEAPKAVFAQAGAVLIEEVSSCGLRLSSDVHLHPDEELVIHLKKDPQPVHATVVWVREARPSLFGTRKSWIAGCRLEPDSMARIRLEPELTGSRFAGLGRKMLGMAALLGAGASLAYLLLRFASFMGSAGGLH